MNKFYSYESYKKLILDKILSLPDKGRGVTQSLSKHMRVNPSFVSQVLKGDKHFSLEQIFSAARFFSFHTLERDFVLTLLQRERAGTHELKMYYDEQLQALRKKSNFVSKRLGKKTILSEQAQARYYSDWIYSAIRLYCTKKNVTLKNICDRFNLSSQKATTVIEFLISVGLIINEDHYFVSGNTNTHLPANSPFIASHHKNWRIKAMARHSDLPEEELAFSSPFGISRENFPLIKEELLEVIARAGVRMDESITEDVACLNIDLFFV